eukprot:4424491-Prymnesium_polylepis.1
MMSERSTIVRRDEQGEGCPTDQGRQDEHPPQRYATPLRCAATTTWLPRSHSVVADDEVDDGAG